MKENGIYKTFLFLFCERGVCALCVLVSRCLFELLITPYLVSNNKACCGENLRVLFAFHPRVWEMARVCVGDEENRNVVDNQDHTLIWFLFQRIIRKRRERE
jgi:hypothetical protein